MIDPPEVAMASVLLKRVRVYDPVLRVIHAWNALNIVLLVITGQIADALELAWPAAALWHIHLWLGYALILGFSARLIWAFVGPDAARWRALWHPAAWYAGLRDKRFFTAPEALGHHPHASAGYLVIYAALLTMAASGLALAAIDQGTGPLYALLGHAAELKASFRLPHDWLQYVFIVFIFAHLGALILHERRHGIPVAQAMVSGYQYIKEKS
jgi:Ni/Fe-hydrogenase 1 B-type cytochrome subunit